MITFIWILATLILLVLIARFIALKMYDLKQTPHHETPKKFGIPFLEIHFPTENRRRLYGWWIPASSQSETAPTLILVHGWSRNLGRMLRYIQALHPMGYNLLAFDARHHGSSDKDGHASMYKFGQDIRAAVRHAVSLDIAVDKIGVVGLSIGGAGSVYAAALEARIRAVVTVGAPAHPVDVMAREFKRHHIPAFLRWVILKQIEVKIGAKYEDFAPVNNIARAAAAFLIIHGALDEVVVPSQGHKLLEASRPGQSELWMIPERGHSNCHHEPGFWERLQMFMDLHLCQEFKS